MSARIVLFGATGFTGRLTAAALVRRGHLPLLVGRDQSRLGRLASQLGAAGSPLRTAMADAADSGALAGRLGPGDVLISTVGPFARIGLPAVQAAVVAGAHYLDSTGEPAFLRRVFEEFDAPARDGGIALVPAFGYDYVPGNLAGALALRRAGGQASRVEIGYFVDGAGFVASGGTTASAAGVALEPGFAWRDGRLVVQRAGARVRSFSVGGRDRTAVSIGGSEHLVLPGLAEAGQRLMQVGVYVGWAGRLSRAAQALSAGVALAGQLPGVRRGLHAAAARWMPGSRGGPDEAVRAATRSLIVAEAYAGDGRQLARTELAGPDPYGLTAELLAEAAVCAGGGGLRAAGALGPVQAFGLDALQALGARAGLAPVPA